MANYGLVDDGFGGWEWSATPTNGLTDDAPGWEWSTDWLYLLTDDGEGGWEWVYAPATPPPPSLAPYSSTIGVRSRRPVLTLSDA